MIENCSTQKKTYHDSERKRVILHECNCVRIDSAEAIDVLLKIMQTVVNFEADSHFFCEK